MITFVALSQIYPQVPTAVIDFEGKGISQTEASALTDRLRTELFNVGFQVMERGLMEEILTEQGFQQTGCTSDECVVEVGKIVGVSQMVGGSISKVGNIFSVSARIVDVETGKIIQMVTHDYQGEISGLLTNGMKQVASLLSGGKVSEAVPTGGMHGTFYISTDPVGAKVWIDDEPQDGITPLLVDNQPVGKHKIYVEKGELSASGEELVETKTIKRVSLTLALAKGSINVLSIPLEATVSVDGERVGLTPLTVEDVLAGEHTLEIEKTDYVGHTEKVVVKKNEIEKVEVHLEKMPLLSVFTEPTGALLFIDKERKGTTPSEELRLNPGKHDILLSLSDYEFYTTSVELMPGAEEEIICKMVREAGYIDITSSPPGVTIYLDGELKGKSPLTLYRIPTGLHKVVANMDGYLELDQMIEVRHKMTTKVDLKLTSIASVKSNIQIINKKRNLWAGLALAAATVGSYFKYSSYAHYQDYKSATTEAGKLHDLIDRDNAIYPVAFGIGMACSLPALYHHWKKEKLKTMISTLETEKFPRRTSP